MSDAISDAEFAAFLDDISQAFVAPDLARWQRRVLYPFTLVTATGPVVIADEAALKRNFRLYLQACQSMHVTSIIRTPISHELCHDGTVIATYRTELLSHAMRLVEPYTSSALLHPTPDGWKMSSIMNALGHHHWTGKHPIHSGDHK